MKRFHILLALTLLGAAGLAHAKGSASKLSMPTFLDEGDSIQPFKMSVGSGTAVQQAWPVYKDVGFSTSTTRTILIQNPSANYALMVGTFTTFGESDNFFIVNPSSGALAFSNNQTLYFRYGSGASTETVRGAVCREK